MRDMTPQISAITLLEILNTEQMLHTEYVSMYSTSYKRLRINSQHIFNSPLILNIITKAMNGTVATAVVFSCIPHESV
jgi:hypothetical protein